jgi:hypothetical protein
MLEISTNTYWSSHKVAVKIVWSKWKLKWFYNSSYSAIPSLMKICPLVELFHVYRWMNRSSEQINRHSTGLWMMVKSCTDNLQTRSSGVYCRYSYLKLWRNKPPAPIKQTTGCLSTRINMWEKSLSQFIVGAHPSLWSAY